MLFHVTHRHTHETCPARSDGFERAKQTFGKVLTTEHAEETGAHLVAAYVDAPAHTVFFIIEADATEALSRFLMPLLQLGSAEIRPVSRADSAYMQRMQEVLGR